MRILMLALAWLVFMIGYNLTDPDKYSFLSRLSQIINKRITKNSRSYEECCKKREVIGDTLLVIGIIIGLATIAW
jgi:hypothetical protein